MPDVRHKRGTRAALDALAAANGLLVGQWYIITDEQRPAIALTTNTYRALPSATPSTPSRVLGTPFRPSTTRPVWCSYTIELTTTLVLVAGQTVEVELRSDTASTPTTSRASVSSQSGGALTIGLSLSRTDRQQLSYIVPAGHYVNLVKTGAGTATIIRQTEVEL